MVDLLDKRLKSVFSIRNELVSCETADHAIDTAVRQARVQASPQTISVFLFSKEGTLRRIRIEGVDRRGRPVDKDWFADEEHNPGDSFTGKAVIPSGSSDFGEPYIANDLTHEALRGDCSVAYSQKLGILRCAIAVPLNGRHRSFGVLEAINKVDEHGQLMPSGSFSSDDIYALSNIGLNLAATLTNLKRRLEAEVITDITRSLVEPLDGKRDQASIYTDVVEKLIGPLFSYKACILRIADDDGTLRVAATAGDRIDCESRLNEPVSKGQRLVGEVHASGEYQIIEDIEQRTADFVNIAWIRANSLKSFAAFPLVVQGTSEGTISVFMGYRYHFYPDNIRFLQNVASLLASFIASMRANEQISNLRQQITSRAQATGFRFFQDSELHNYKHAFRKLQRALQKAVIASPNETKKLLKEQLREVNQHVERITAELVRSSPSSSLTSVDLNNTIRDVVKFFVGEANAWACPIEFEGDYCQSLPLITVDQDHIWDVIFNLVSNAIQAVQAANRRKGRVTVRTQTVDLEIPYIQIEIEDNGIGIRNEDRERVYLRGFSTYREGTGMGLFLTRSIIESLYGGTIDFESTVGKGARFIVRLPRIRLAA